MAWIAALSATDSHNEYWNGYNDAIDGLPYNPTIVSLDMDNRYADGYKDGTVERKRKNG